MPIDSIGSSAALLTPSAAAMAATWIRVIAIAGGAVNARRAGGVLGKGSPSVLQGRRRRLRNRRRGGSPAHIMTLQDSPSLLASRVALVGVLHVDGRIARGAEQSSSGRRGVTYNKCPLRCSQYAWARAGDRMPAPKSGRPPSAAAPIGASRAAMLSMWKPSS